MDFEPIETADSKKKYTRRKVLIGGLALTSGGIIGALLGPKLAQPVIQKQRESEIILSDEERIRLAKEWCNNITLDQLMAKVREAPPEAVSNSFLTMIEFKDQSEKLHQIYGSGLVLGIVDNGIGILLTARHLLYDLDQNLEVGTHALLNRLLLSSNPGSAVYQISRGIFVPHPNEDVAVVAFPTNSDRGPMEFIKPELIEYLPQYKPQIGEIIRGYSFPAAAWETKAKSIPLVLKVVGTGSKDNHIFCQHLDSPVTSGASGSALFNIDQKVIGILSGYNGLGNIVLNPIPPSLNNMIDLSSKTLKESIGG